MNEAPRRLVDDPAVSSSLRDDLARAGEEHRAYASAYDAASKGAIFQALLSSPGGVAAGTGVLVKLVLGTAAAAAFMFAGAALHARLHARSEAADPRAAIVPAPAPAPVAPVSTPHVVQAPPIITPQTPAKPVEAPVAAPSSRARRPQQDDTQELRQLVRIRAYLQSGQAASALELAERGQRELGQSALWQEREALAVLALFELGRSEQAEQRSAVLLARFPDSPFRAELERRSRGSHER